MASRMSILASVSLIGVLLSASLHADIFTIATKRVNVPSPEGFTRATEDMAGFIHLMEFMEDQLNDTLAFYIPDLEVPNAMMGDVPIMERYFVLKANKNLRDVTVGQNDFVGLKETLKNNNREILREVRSLLSDSEDARNRRFNDELGVDLFVETAQMIPLDPHFEGDTSIAYSMYLRQDVRTSDSQETETFVATNTVLNAAGTILFLYSYADEDDLEWTRNVSRDWAESVIASNDLPPMSSSTGGRRGLWGLILSAGLIGGLTAGIGGLLIRLVRRVFSARTKPPAS